MTKTYGSQQNPVEYTYDAQGRQLTMTTWQDFNASTGTGNSGDATTTWIYDSERGWLNRKEYADEEGTDYTYTPDVRYTYTRSGQQSLVEDGQFATAAFSAGDILASVPALDTTRYTYDYSYTSEFLMETETVSGLLTADAVLTRGYQDGSETETKGLVGRSAGYSLSTDGGSNIDAEATYTYSNSDRLSALHVLSAFDFNAAATLARIWLQEEATPLLLKTTAIAVLAKAPEPADTALIEGYPGGRSILQEYVARMRPPKTKASLKLAFAPGECAQVDWGHAGSVRVGNTRRQLSFFVMTLGYWYIRIEVTDEFIPKGYHIRSIPIPVELAQEILNACKDNGSEYVISGHKTYRIKKLFDEVNGELRQNYLKGIRRPSYELRKFFATGSKLQIGLEKTHVRMGHKDDDTTKKHYIDRHATEAFLDIYKEWARVLFGGEPFSK